MQMPPVTAGTSTPMSPMTPPVSPIPPSLASLERVAELLQVAQQVAALGAHAPQAVSQAQFLEAAIAAKDAAEMLLITEPRSQYQDLKLASEHVTRGYDLLVRAANSTAGIVGGVTTDAQVARYAHDALDDFDQAYEILDND